MIQFVLLSFFLTFASDFYRTDKIFLFLLAILCVEKNMWHQRVVVAGSVVPTGTTGPGNKDASETPWKENNPTTGGVGVGGGEFSGDDW